MANGSGGLPTSSSSTTLSTESPPFNPRGMSTMSAAAKAQSPGPVNNSSRSNSPMSHASNGHGNGHGNGSTTAVSGSAHSNAVPKHTFQYGGESLEIRNVWAENMEEEMANIRELMETHPYVAMDTEFPGVVARPVSETYAADFHYKSLKVNVDLLRIIQLGLSFSDKEGVFAKGCPCWQFNFKFSLGQDMFAQDSIDLLVHSGISFEDHATRGIDPERFGESLMVSGLVLDDRVKWVSFHSGYDYGYLLKLLTSQELPKDEKTFFETLRLYFPTIYDLKYMTSLCDGHFGGLQKLADALQCQRIGAEHQAGSDSLLTMTTYFALAKAKFCKGNSGSSGGRIDDSKYKNELYGYGSNHTVRKGNAHAQVHLTSSNSAISMNGNSIES